MLVFLNLLRQERALAPILFHKISMTRGDLPLACDALSLRSKNRQYLCAKISTRKMWLNRHSSEFQHSTYWALCCHSLRQARTENGGEKVGHGRAVSTSRAEELVNEIANARMEKSAECGPQKGAHRVATVRAAVLDGRLGAGQLHTA